MEQRLSYFPTKASKVKVRMLKQVTKNKIPMKALLSVTLFFFFFSATTICEEPFVPNVYHKDCLSSEHCLSSQIDNSKHNTSTKSPLPISHCHIGSSCAHNSTKSESLKPLIQTDTPTLIISFNYSILESNLIKSIFNPPRTLI